jgi:hypothetical protein
MKRWLVRLAVLTAVGLSLLLALSQQRWSLLTVKNVGSTDLTLDRAFGRQSIKGVLKPGQRRFGLFRIESEAEMGFLCRSPGPPPVSMDAGYYLDFPLYVLALDLKNCEIAASRELRKIF